MKWIHSCTLQTAMLLYLITLEPVLLSAAPYGAYQVGPACYPSQEIRYPKSNEEVVAIVKEAILKGLNVKAFGARHSITDIICTEGIPVDMKYFQKKVLNTDGSATFGSGVIMWDVGGFLTKHDRALKTAPAYGNITVAGAIGTGAHGTSIKYHSTLSEQVVGLTIVDGVGSIRKISCESSLKAFRIHLGLLGIVLDVTFKTVPFYKILAHNYEISDDILVDGRAERIAREADQALMLWYPFLNKVIVFNQTYVNPETEGDAYANYVSSTTKEANLQKNDEIEALQRLAPEESARKINESQSTGYKAFIEDGYQTNNPSYTEDGNTLKNPAVGDWNRMVTSICQKEGRIQCEFIPEMGEAQTKVLESEFSLSFENLAETAKRLKQIASVTPAAFLAPGLVLRFSAASDTYMSMSQGRDTVHLGFYLYKRKNEYTDPSPWLPALQTFSQSLAMEFGGRSHWGKSGPIYHTGEMIDRKLDPSAKSAFISQMMKYDPWGIFLNSFGKRFLGIGVQQDIDPKTQHCALLDNCICQHNYHCANSQVCGRIEGYNNYNVCR